LDIFSSRKMTLPQNYEKIWNHLDMFQKMKIAINNELYVVKDKNEMYQLLKTYPYQMMDFIKSKIIPKPNFMLNTIEICIEDLGFELKDLAIDIFKSFALLNYDDVILMRQEMSKGNGVTEIKMPPELVLLFPFCIVKVKEIFGTNCTVQKIKPGYHFYDIQANNFIFIKDYNYILRESKLERLLNNPSD
jgi:hypothetical protein